MNIELLYEDNHILAVNKPVNVPVQEDSSGDPDLLNELKYFIKERDSKPGNVYLALLHRLDRPVGGTMIFGKTSKAASRLSNEFRLNTVDKTYYAIVRGSHLKEKDTLTDYLYKNRDKNKVYVVDASHKKGKKAVLHYEVLAKTSDFSLLKIKLETGRSHQIRVQLSNLGSPLYGDQKYGQQVNKPGQQIALFSKELSFKHPTLKEEVTVSAELKEVYPWTDFSHILFQ